MSQQEYRGKRAYIRLSDNTGHSIKSKIDFGVHTKANIKQDTYCFDVCLDDQGASLLINSKEQMFTEKLSSLLKFGPLSTRYKDIFDMYYLSESLDVSRLRDCVAAYVYDNPLMREKDANDVRSRVVKTFLNKRFQANLDRSGRANWMQVKPKTALKGILDLIKDL